MAPGNPRAHNSTNEAGLPVPSDNVHNNADEQDREGEGEEELPARGHQSLPTIKGSVPGSGQPSIQTTPPSITARTRTRHATRIQVDCL